MRKYIRHPSDIPIDFHVYESDSSAISKMRDISEGGLCFDTDMPMTPGTKIHIHIPLAYQPNSRPTHGESAAPLDFEADGVVAWCRKAEQKFSVGVQFADEHTQFGVRMVEQVCHIEHYRFDVLQAEGRELTVEEAAREWVERYAAEFPC